MAPRPDDNPPWVPPAGPPPWLTADKGLGCKAVDKGSGGKADDKFSGSKADKGGKADHKPWRQGGQGPGAGRHRPGPPTQLKLACSWPPPELSHALSVTKQVDPP